MSNVGSATQFNLVFINLEQVIIFCRVGLFLEAREGRPDIVWNERQHASRFWDIYSLQSSVIWENSLVLDFYDLGTFSGFRFRLVQDINLL